MGEYLDDLKGMFMKKRVKTVLVIAILLFVGNTAFAQIGYQVSLLNSATGQPRAGETVTVDIKLANCENTTVYTTQQKATSNDFGVLSLSVGDAKTFDELDWNKLPLYIEVSIDGVLIAKSQVLSVPVAEYAKKSGFVLTKEFLASKTWIYIQELYKDYRTITYQFNTDGTYSRMVSDNNNTETTYGAYLILNNIIYTSPRGDVEKSAYVLHYVPEGNYMICDGNVYE